MIQHGFPLIHGVIIHPRNPNSNRWSPEEIQIMKDYYENGGTRYMARMLPKRHKVSIALMAQKLGLKKRPYNPMLLDKC